MNEKKMFWIELKISTNLLVKKSSIKNAVLLPA